jgi:hypothetical protein
MKATERRLLCAFMPELGRTYIYNSADEPVSRCTLISQPFYLAIDSIATKIPSAQF